MVFVIALRHLCVQVCAAMQSHKSTLADSARYFAILAKTLKKATERQSDFDSDFLAHAFTVFNRRWAVQATTVTRLALFLHPGYRVLSSRDGEWKELKMKVSLCSVAWSCFVLNCCVWYMHDWLHAMHVLVSQSSPGLALC